MANGDPPPDPPPVPPTPNVTPASAGVKFDSPDLDTGSMGTDELLSRLQELEAKVGAMTTPTASGGENFGPEVSPWSETAQASAFPENPDARTALGDEGVAALFNDLAEDEEIISYNVRGDKVIVALNTGVKRVKPYVP